MKPESVIILQEFGIGDCIFSQGIAHHYIKSGFRVYWPVRNYYLTDLKRAYQHPMLVWLPEDLYVSPNVYPDPERIKYDLLHSIVAPIHRSNSFIGEPYYKVMRAKYDMYGLDWATWREHAMWKPDVFKEDELLEMHNINPDDQFTIISTAFGGGSFEETTQKIEVNNGMKRVYIKKIEGYSIFDWAKLMRLATEIHFVSSCNIYLLEMMSELRADKIHIYPRIPKDYFHRNYQYIMTKHIDKYIFH
jgi:hypothetical protein